MHRKRQSDIMTLLMIHVPFVTSGGVVLKWKENNHDGKRGRASAFMQQQMRGDNGKKVSHYGTVCLYLVLTCKSFESPTKTITDIFPEQRLGPMSSMMVLCSISNAQDASHKEFLLFRQSLCCTENGIMKWSGLTFGST